MINFFQSKWKFSLFILCASLIFAVLGHVLFFPSFDDYRSRLQSSDFTLFDSAGHKLNSERTEFQWRRLPWEAYSAYSSTLVKTIIQTEDQRFWHHYGVDFFSIGRALRAYLGHKGRHPIQGASTITQQVASLLRAQTNFDQRGKIKKRNLFWKLVQILDAIALEAKWSKVQILETYLNLVHLKGELQGLPALSKISFNKHVKYLNLSEASVVSALIRAPNAKLEVVKHRACLVLERAMSSSGQTPYHCEDIDSPLQKVFEKSTSPFFSLPPQQAKAFHLARRIRGMTSKDSARSFIHAELQAQVEGILHKNLLRLKRNRVHDAAALVIENKSGRVLSYVGSQPKTSSAWEVDGVSAPRQAGSTLKPFFYARAMDRKLIDANSIYTDDDTPLSWNSGTYRPVNYDRQFYGPVTVRTALASSLNVPAVKVLLGLGLAEGFAVLKELQFKNLSGPDSYGASMALGAVDVQLDELANAYRAIANDGQLTPLKFFEEQNDQTPSVQLMSAQTASVLRSILSDAVARSLGFGAESVLETRYYSAVKTGTSKGARDNWCIGFSEHYTVAVWAGNFSSERMIQVSGVSGAAPSWREIMDYLHKWQKQVSPQVSAQASVQAPHIQRPQIQNSSELSGYESFHFVFPVDGSTLVLSPHQHQQEQRLQVRYKGVLPPDAALILDGINLGYQKTRTVLNHKLSLGKHTLRAVDSQGRTLSQADFTVR